MNLKLIDLLIRLKQIADANDDEFLGRMNFSLTSGPGGIEFSETAEDHHFFGAVFANKADLMKLETLATEEGLENACKAWGYKYPAPLDLKTVVYRIHREGEPDKVGDVHLFFVTASQASEIKPDLSLKVRNHSPTGFEFGYAGSGPSQLALAIMLHATGSETRALKYYRDFLTKFIAPMQHPGGEITAQQIQDFMRGQ